MKTYQRIYGYVEQTYGAEQAKRVIDNHNITFVKWLFLQWRHLLVKLYYLLSDNTQGTQYTWENGVRHDRRSKWQKFIEKMGITNNSFCDYCGRTTRADFLVSDSLWREVMGVDQHVACYDCFTEIAEKHNKCPSYWHLQNGDNHPVDLDA